MSIYSISRELIIWKCVEDRQLGIWTDTSRYPEALADHRISANQHCEVAMVNTILECVRSISIGEALTALHKKLVRPPHNTVCENMPHLHV